MDKGKKKNVLITGSAGLIGSEAVRFFSDKGFKVIGIDNDARKYFFGPSASTAWNKRKLEKEIRDYKHYSVDIRNQKKIEEIFKNNTIDLIIHAAAQPSHDWAAKEPLTDFTINALGTLILLEAYRKFTPNAVFIYCSTNKVYGDNPNRFPFVELNSRYELSKNHKSYNGIDESMSLDDNTHSIFGVSKTAADLMVQEYGKYFGLPTGIFRGGCLTGPAHSPAQLHGFLAYLVSSIADNKEYTIFGYKGKQVRDNLHSYDVVNAFYHFYLNPRKGEVYNIGGSRHSNISVLDAIEKIEKILGKKAKVKYNPKNRIGDHIWYISDVSKFKSHFPKWEYTYTSDQILEELCRYAVLYRNSKS
ncbi:MAG: CDP-paratose 2-epimerase [Microgenomates group bacterium Gr01-1014_7]|nr:MAG: CDP-paratose 2-epimerase [Microgenomates group bacterium Gr01-1014_7]